jgi:hypothetical protein
LLHRCLLLHEYALDVPCDLLLIQYVWLCCDDVKGKLTAAATQCHFGFFRGRKQLAVGLHHHRDVGGLAHL